MELKPDYAEAHSNLGHVLRQMGRLEEAEACCRRALELQPDNAACHHNLGAALAARDQFAEAETCLRRALELQPDFPEAHNNLGTTLGNLGRFAEAEASCRRALELRPDDPEFHNHYGATVMNLGRFAEAATHFQRAAGLKPNHPEYHTNLGFMLLLLGDFEHGWPEYEWRLRLKGGELPALPQPLWDGSALDGRTILLHAEQGLGDTLQFIRYAPLVKQRGGIVLCQCPRRLAAVLRSCPGIDQVVPVDTALPRFDVRAALVSLPRLFGTTPATIPAPVPYLTADAALVEKWRARLRPCRAAGSASSGAGAARTRGTAAGQSRSPNSPRWRGCRVYTFSACRWGRARSRSRSLAKASPSSTLGFGSIRRRSVTRRPS